MNSWVSYLGCSRYYSEEQISGDAQRAEEYGRHPKTGRSEATLTLAPAHLMRWSHHHFSKESAMKKNLRKLTLNRETLQKLGATTANLVVGGISLNGCDSEFESCGGTCATRCSGCCCV